MTEEEECAGKVVEAAHLGWITVHVLVPRPCITIGDPPDQALQEIYETEFRAEKGITIGELKENIEKHENIPAREQTIIRQYAGDRKIPPPDDMDLLLPDNLELLQDCCLEVLVLNVDSECACGKRKLESLDKKYLASCSKAEKFVKVRISLDQHMKAEHPDIPWEPRPSITLEPRAEGALPLDPNQKA